MDAFTEYFNINPKFKNKYNLVGHSMGGRVAIMLSQLEFINISKTSVIDIGPFLYAGSTR